jgi:hypothetical protein
LGIRLPGVSTRTLAVAVGVLITCSHVTGLSKSADRYARYRPPANCKRFFGAACSRWRIGAWLPSYGDSNNPWQEGRVQYIHRSDHFTIHAEQGTFFVYGTAGPPRGHALYDSAHRIAFYEQGCCSWHDVVAAANVDPPPKSLIPRDLTRLRTIRGVRLGMSPRSVMRIYGRTTMRDVIAHPGITILAYTTWPPAAAVEGPPARVSSCGQFENFYFRGNRLVLIQLGNAC